MKLDVFLRTCSRKGIHSNPRIVNDDRETMIKKCFVSLCVSLLHFKQQYDVKLWIVDDNSSPEFIKFMKEAIPSSVKYEIFEHLEPIGFHGSAVKQMELAKQEGTDIVYLLEDDYFHSPLALTIMANTIEHIESIQATRYAAVFPYDCIDRYQRDFPEPCRVFYNDGIYFRTVNKSSMTVMMKHEVFKTCFDDFIFLARNFNPDGSVDEDTTINKLYSNWVDEEFKPIILLSPIPSLAVHIEYKDPTFISNLGISNFHKQWNEY